MNVRLVLATEHGVVIPPLRTQLGQEGSYVYTVNENETAELRTVKLGQQQGDQVVVIAGLAPNERVVLQGQSSVKPGAKVRIATAPAAAAYAAPKQIIKGRS